MFMPNSPRPPRGSAKRDCRGLLNEMSAPKCEGKSYHKRGCRCFPRESLLDVVGGRGSDDDGRRSRGGRCPRMAKSPGRREEDSGPLLKRRDSATRRTAPAAAAAKE